MHTLPTAVRTGICSLIVILLFGTISFAQERLTNADVVALVRSGLGQNAIVAKIRASAASFDTSTTALVKLAEAGVPDAIVSLMVETQATSKSAFNDIPEHGSLKDLAGKRTYYLVTDDTKATGRIDKEMKRGGFSPTDRAEDADFIMKYRQWEEPTPGSVYTTKYGLLEIVTSGGNGDRVRNVYSVRKSKYLITTSEPAEAVAKQFINDFHKTK